MKCSMREIDAGNAALVAERDRLQLSEARHAPGRAGTRDPFLRAPPKAPDAPCRVEMLVEGLREIQERGE